MTVPWTQIPVPGVHIEHTPGWELDDDHPWRMYFPRPDRAQGPRAAVSNEPGPAPGSRGTGQPAQSSYSTSGITIPDAGVVEIVQTHLPVAPLEQQVRLPLVRRPHDAAPARVVRRRQLESPSGSTTSRVSGEQDLHRPPRRSAATTGPWSACGAGTGSFFRTPSRRRRSRPRRRGKPRANGPERKLVGVASN